MNYVSAILLLVILASSCATQIDEVDSKYGVSYNERRKHIGVPLLQSTMELREDLNSRRYLYSDLNRDRSLPGHWWKELLTDSLLSLQLEKDFFYNPQTDAWLTSEHNYRTGSTIYEYHDDSRNGGSKLRIDSRQGFDSVLKAWNVVFD